MIRAGIYDPESKEGIDFCLNYCPYDCCVVFEREEAKRARKAREIANFCKALRARWVSVDDIALITGKSRGQVMRYLRL